MSRAVPLYLSTKVLLKGYAEAGALDGEHESFTEDAVN